MGSQNGIMDEINQLITKKENEQQNLTQFLSDIRTIAQKLGDVELQNKLRRMTCSINRTFCLFDEFECLYEETKLPQLIASAPESGAKSVVTQTSIEIQTDNANDSIIDWKSVVDNQVTQDEDEVVQINFKTEQPRKLSVESLSSTPSPASRTSSRSTSPVTEATVKKFQKILAETQKNALEAKKMIDDVKNGENNNKKAVVIKGSTKLGKYNRKAKSHGGGNDNNSNNQRVPPIKRARKSIDDTIERIKKKRDNCVEMSFEEMVMKNALKFYADNF